MLIIFVLILLDSSYIVSCELFSYKFDKLLYALATLNV